MRYNNNIKMVGFDKNFIFGAATAAFQIEGGACADGKGLSIWDVFCRDSDTVFEGHDGKTACNSYELWEQDVELLSELGADAYRFSVSWPRVFPEGTGKVNQKGLDYYKRLTDSLIGRGIEPYVTLYHWDLPYELSLKGGFTNRDFAGWFTDYAETVAKALGDGVKTYFTFNEPQSIVGAGYGLGVFAPGIKYGDGSFPALHNMLLAHGDSAAMLHSLGKEVGIVNCGDAPYPYEDTPELCEAVRKKLFAPDHVWSYVNVFDPVFSGDYCPEFYSRYPEQADYFIKSGDLRRIASGTDYCCMNHYSGYPAELRDGKLVERKREAGYGQMSIGWAADVKGLYYTMKFLAERYNKPLMIAENGMACYDCVSSDGKVHDAARVDYFERMLSEVRRMIDDGLDIRAYFAWSLLDNFEWLCGYAQRFGIVHVDYGTYKRTPKDSFYYLKKVFGKRNRELCKGGKS